MIYLLDANVLIDADRDFYPIDRVPEFWEWLYHHASNGSVKMCAEVFEEVSDGRGEMPSWLKQRHVREAIVLAEEPEQHLVARIVDEGYAPDLTDVEIVTVGRDPFLIAHAVADMQNRVVVTTETAAPSKTRANRRIPDVCRQFGVRPLTGFQFFRAMNFSTRWQAELPARQS